MLDVCMYNCIKVRPRGQTTRCTHAATPGDCVRAYVQLRSGLVWSARPNFLWGLCMYGRVMGTQSLSPICAQRILPNTYVKYSKLQ